MVLRISVQTDPPHYWKLPASPAGLFVTKRELVSLNRLSKPTLESSFLASPSGFSCHLGPPTDWDQVTHRNIQWSVSLGSATFAAPVVAGGQVYIGTNNEAGYLERFPAKVDLGCLRCFREADGQFMWQFSAEKLPTGRVHDWPHQGLVSSPLVEADRLWFVSSRHVLTCLDAKGFRDGENDGPFVELARLQLPDIDAERGVLMVRQGKGRKDRMVPIGDRALAWTEKYRRDEASSERREAREQFGDG